MTSGALSRVVVLLTALVVTFFLLLASGVAAGGAHGETTVHVVQSGETLWQIARDLTAEGGDVRKTVFDLRELNGLPEGQIMAGDRIRIPGGG